ncbi:MAG: acyl carrier protein [Bacteroidetes bacterium]|jgi:acyl carrier protein|nr:acyl carrier protein [Bacteroidota bacterium]PTM12452.1 MAG: acyl carrier protein [Bacteroidota bacterium]
MMKTIDKNEFLAHLHELLELENGQTLGWDTRLLEIEEWDSLVALSFMALAKEEYDVELGGDDIRGAETVQDFYDLLVNA